MLAMATFVYLPDHLITVSRRAYYYFAGDTVSGDFSSQAANAVGKASAAAIDTAAGLIGNAYQAAVNTADVAQDVVSTATPSVAWT